MTEWANLFRGKKITVMGLGLLGRGVGDVKFLAECGADLIVTDLKSEKELAPSLKKLKTYNLKPITYHLGGHRLQDFCHRDFILKAASVPLDSPYIAAARKHGVPVEMSTALFAKLAAARGVTIVGITGTRGKSTTTQLIYEILKQAPPRLRSGQKNSRIFLGGNVRGVSTLAFLPRLRRGDIAVLELDSWQLQGFGPTSLKLRGASDKGVSPQIAVFTNFLDDHLNYYRGDRKRYWQDKANIFKYQKPGDYLVLGEQFKRQNSKFKITGQKSKVIVVDKKNVPRNWKIKLPGEHNLNNIALAMKVAEILGVEKAIIKKAVESFRSVPGRLELVRVWRGIKIYNDTTATTPDATIAALRAVGQPKKKSASRRIILIAGGADKNLALADLIKLIPKYCKTLILLPGTGTEKFKRQNPKVKSTSQNLKEAVETAVRQVKRGDVILFSPGFASFGLFKNEYDRGDQFSRLVKKLR